MASIQQDLLDLPLGDELAAFRAEVSGFFREQMARAPRHLDPRDLTGFDESFERDLLRAAGERGLLGMHLPREHGGGGRPLSYKAVFDFEAAYWNAPAIDTPVTLVAPQILAFGSPAQREAWLGPMIRGELLACIAYSEAGAGSDLSAIETRAHREGEGFVISGSKAHVTAAHKADLICLIARTDPDAPVRSGASILVLDMRSPGISVERRATMNGWTLGDVRLDEVRAGPDALLGEWNGGWAQMAAALRAERSGMFHVGWAVRNLEDLVAHVRAGGRIGVPRALARERLARLRCDLETALGFSLRVVAAQDAGNPEPHEASMAKLYATELLQRIARVATSLLGPAGSVLPGGPGAPVDGRFAWEYLERVHPTIGAGTSEMQREAIAAAGLELPRR